MVFMVMYYRYQSPQHLPREESSLSWDVVYANEDVDADGLGLMT